MDPDHFFELEDGFSGPCNSFYRLGYFKNVYDDDDGDDDGQLDIAYEGVD